MAKVINENIVRDFVKALKAERKKPSAYDTTAKVLRVDGDTAWVHIAGGVDETPVKLTVNAEKGDEVQVRVGGGKAWIVGNATAPPTDDKTANIAHKRAVNADNKAIVAKQTAEEADVKADTAKEKADEAIEAVGASITTDILHYLATSLDSGVTINTPGWTTTVQSMTSTNRYLWTYHTYQKASGQSVNTNPVITGVYGQTGPQGEPGTAGTSITITNIRYAISTTESQPADSSFTYTSVPSVPEGNWLWTRTLYSDNSKVYTKAKQGETGPQGATGDDGVSITAVQPQYNLSTSTSSATGTWSNTLTYETGKYIWTREKITYSNNTTGYSTAIYNEALTSACANAEDALTMAEKIEQHFWTDADGAHVTEVTQEEYLDDPTHAGGNTLITSTGLRVRDGLKDLAEMSKDGFDAKTYDEQGNEVVIAHLGYGPGADSGGGTSDAPYYTVGSRRTTTTPYDSSATYKVGDLCYYLTNVYVCREDTPTPAGSFNSKKWRIAIGNYSFVEGESNVASGLTAHAEGSETTATGYMSHSEGYKTASVGVYSHAEGHGTIANRKAQTTIGEYNTKDASGLSEFFRGDHALIIGNGTDDNSRSNALTVDWQGGVAFADPSRTFVVESVEIETARLNSGANGQYNVTAQKEGYYPIGVVGFSCVNGSLVARRMYIDTQAIGSCNAVVNVRNVASSAASASSVTLNILWVKAT